MNPHTSTMTMNGTTIGNTSMAREKYCSRADFRLKISSAANSGAVVFTTMAKADSLSRLASAVRKISSPASSMKFFSPTKFDTPPTVQRVNECWIADRNG